MAHLIHEYAKNLGVKISQPVVNDHFFPLLADKYITLHQPDQFSSKTYAHYDIVLSLLKPFLDRAKIKVVQLGGQAKIEGADAALNLSFKQQSFVISNSLVHLGCDGVLSQLASLKKIPTVTLFGNTFPSTTKPVFSSNSLNSLLSPKWDKKPCFSVEDPQKQINSIKAEEVAQSVLDFLNIEKEDIKFRTKHIGNLFSSPVVEVVPTSFIPLRLNQGQPVILRCDYGCNESALIEYCQKYHAIVTLNKLIQPHGLEKFGQNISDIYIFVDKTWETIPESYFNLLKNLNIVPTLLVKEEKDLGIIRNKYFDVKVNLYEKNKKAPCKVTENTQFMSSLRLIEGGKEYLSYAHWKKGLDTNNKVLDTPEYWNESDHFYIYERD